MVYGSTFASYRRETIGIDYSTEETNISLHRGLQEVEEDGYIREVAKKMSMGGQGDTGSTKNSGRKKFIQNVVKIRGELVRKKNRQFRETHPRKNEILLAFPTPTG